MNKGMNDLFDSIKDWFNVKMIECFDDWMFGTIDF